MEPRCLTDLVEACGGEILSGPSRAMVNGLRTDSRGIRPGDLFVALAGERFDGHDFLPDVAKRGAVAVIVNRGKAPALPPDCTVVSVDDTRRALGRIAAWYRRDFKLPVVAVAGSNGKTTTKELTGAVLRQRFRTLVSEASFNNDIGVPLTLLNLERAHETAVLEAGTNHPGELAPLVRMIAPRLGVVTSIGREHLEHFGDLHGVIEEEGWLAELLPADGTLFVAGESPHVDNLVRRTKANVIRAGFGPGNDWRASSVTPDETGVTFQVDAPDRAFRGEYRVNLLGRHQALNALLAAAVGAELALTRDEVLRGLLECQPPKMRMQVWTANGVRVLDDAYNANADSMAVALQTLVDFPCAGRRVAVLGDMAELGRHSAEAHAEVGHRAAELKVDQLFAVGKMAGVMGAGARSAGLIRVTELGEVETVASAVKHFVRKGDVVLVKASRAARLERVVEALRGNGPTK